VIAGGSSAGTPPRQALAGYLAVRRSLGYKLDRPSSASSAADGVNPSSRMIIDLFPPGCRPRWIEAVGKPVGGVRIPADGHGARAADGQVPAQPVTRHWSWRRDRVTERRLTGVRPGRAQPAREHSRRGCGGR